MAERIDKVTRKVVEALEAEVDKRIRAEGKKTGAKDVAKA